MKTSPSAIPIRLLLTLTFVGSSVSGHGPRQIIQDVSIEKAAATEAGQAKLIDSSDETDDSDDDSNDDADDIQTDTRFHECTRGKGVAEVSFRSDGRLLQEGEGMRTSCRRHEKCARFCYDSETTCSGAPDAKVITNSYHYVSGWNVTENGDYLLYCCAASLMISFQNCSNVTVEESALQIDETFENETIVKDIYFDNGKDKKPTMVEVCKVKKAALKTPLKLTCKLPHHGIHPKHHKPPPAPENQMAEAAKLANGEAAGLPVGEELCLACVFVGLAVGALGSTFIALGAVLSALASTGSGSGASGRRRRKREAASQWDEHMRWLVFQSVQGSAPKSSSFA